MRIVTVSCSVGLAALLIAPAPGFASAADQDPQESNRSALLAAERDKKATEVTPPERSRIEDALYRYDNSAGFTLFGNWHGFHLAGGDFPAGAGTKFGVGFTHDLGAAHTTPDPSRPNRFEVDAVAAYSTLGYGRASAALNLHNAGGASLDLRLRAQHYRFPQEDFFGFGQDSRKGDRTDYLIRGNDVAADVQWKPRKRIDVGGGVSYLAQDTGAGTDARFPSIEELFDASTLPGFAAQPDFVRADASIAYDWRDNPLHPHAGGRYGLQTSSFHDQDSSAFGFQRTSIDLQQYVPLPNRYRTLALHAAAVFTDPYAGQTVPFYYQPTLGGSQTLRGFREFRFRDRNSLALTAEYRWEAWWALDGVLFVDAGKVGATRHDLTTGSFDTSYGFGFRVHSNSAFVARLDLAFSREGFIPLLRFEHVF